MNLGTCALFQFFSELSVWGKVAFIAGYILMALLLALWEKSKARRRITTRTPELTPHSTIKVTKKLIHAVPTSTPKYDQYDAFDRVRHLLETFGSNLSKSVVYCKPHNGGKNHLKYLHQYTPKSLHIRTIVSKLRRRVNHSGTEPGENLLGSSPCGSVRAEGGHL
jgi:hypothetical protein